MRKDAPDRWHKLETPTMWSSRGRRAFLDFARALSKARSPDTSKVLAAKRTAMALNDPGLPAALHVLHDLASQGWRVSVSDRGGIAVGSPEAEKDPTAEKARVRQQELLKRDEQLATPSVRRFVVGMERPREFNDRFVSIFSLMRDGKSLANDLRRVAHDTSPRPSVFRDVIDPYVQIIGSQDRCAHTGFRLMDIWRYFRHTWTNQYTSTPGRTMLILVRDRAAEFHPVLGIAALGSAIVQIGERDRWIGWQPDEFLDNLAKAPSLDMARWIVMRLEQGLEQLHLDDLIEDGLYWPSLWESPTEPAIEKLVSEADSRRRDHHRFVRGSELKSKIGERNWRDRAESDLFRSKRCLALADLLRARMVLGPFLGPKPTVRGLRQALDEPNGRRAISAVLRRAKSESVGTEIADLTVCGAVAPYNSVLGGKLVSMLAVSPLVVRAYRERYREHPSEIASSLAGRPIQRRSRLVFIGTTSLYGSGSSQYSRVRIPKHILGGGSEIVFRRLGKSRSFGTSHLSSGAVAALVTLAQHSQNGVRVNSIFGEGVNPKLRKVRFGLDLLGWPSDDLLQHRRPRLVYGVSLVSNLLPYLIGLHKQPRYAFQTTAHGDTSAITSWWFERWLTDRIKSDDVLAKTAANTVDRPVRHGARVVLPSLPDEHEQSS